jgi:hypothetical protein
MGKIKHFSISLSQQSDTYLAGQDLSGIVKIDLDEKIKIKNVNHILI